MPTNVDGYFDHDGDPRDLCRHGTYVGGCGWDLMCHACEMGDPDPTVNELLAIRAGNIRLLHQRIAGAIGPSFTFGGVVAQVLGELVTDAARDLERGLRRLDAEIAEARVWSTHDDDDTWMGARHDAALRAFYGTESDHLRFTV